MNAVNRGTKACRNIGLVGAANPDNRVSTTFPHAESTRRRLWLVFKN